MEIDIFSLGPAKFAIFFAIVVFVAIIGFKIGSSTSKSDTPLKKTLEQEREEDKARWLIFDSLSDNELLNLTKYEIQGKIGNAVGGNGVWSCPNSFVPFALQFRKKLCKDFDGRISTEEREKKENMIGTLSPKVICQFCQEKGTVYKMPHKSITSGVVHLSCVNCGTRWDISATTS